MKMKYIGMLACLFWVLAACKDDDVFFDASVPAESLRFEAIGGGAVMHYTLPDDTDICAICARYVNERGEDVTILGTPFVDSIVLTGFNAPRMNVPVSITVTDNNNIESVPVERTFNTLASAPYAFIDSVMVSSSWGGFNIESSFTGTASGRVDVYRVGKNPFTKEIDTLYIRNFAIQSGDVRNFFSVDGDEEETTIVLRTEDGNGNFVRSAVFAGLQKYNMEQYPRENMVLSDPGNSSYEFDGEPSPANNYTTGFGIKYLNDGDKTGVSVVASNNDENYFTYMTVEDPIEPYVQVELSEPHVIAVVRLYTKIRNLAFFDYFNGYDFDYLPCHIKVVASNDPSLPMEEWDVLAELEQPRGIRDGSWGDHPSVSITEPSGYDNIDPVYAELACDMVETEYRYLRVITLDHFQTSTSIYGNVGNRISYHELEVYVQKD